MATQTEQQESFHYQLRLLLEEVCCELCRFEHVNHDGCPPESVQIDREFNLGVPNVFADIRVAPASGPPYFVEVKFGYSKDLLLRHLRRKYGPESPAAAWGSKIILVSGSDGSLDRQSLAADLSRSLDPRLGLEVWDERLLLAKIRECFRADYQTITTEHLLDLREAIDRAKGYYAFSGTSFEEYKNDPLRAQLLWHFGFWRLRQLRESGRPTPRDILPPGNYRGVAVVLADLCSFSSFVRDTPDSEIVRECLTSFYSKTRYQIINNGGMLYQFVGDEVIGFFGLPEAEEGFVARALDTAKAVLSIGESVSHHWQRRIDRVQNLGGVHVGMAIGDLQIVSLRPFSRTHVGAIGDCINVAARLMATASQGEIAVSNSYHLLLPEETQGEFQEVEPIEARNVGRIKAWKFRSGAGGRSRQEEKGG
ncbi:MAG: adenylate/guanylate cyclase domain-containing protein [Candidatus Dormibacteraeota bacterium]|nr:adenylate/guanylate cyclase domain-containing protein [Candidatus Dormibacteraeota bacterium]